MNPRELGLAIDVAGTPTGCGAGVRAEERALLRVAAALEVKR